MKSRFIYRAFFFVYREILSIIWKYKFASFGTKSYISNPLRIDGAINITIGKNVYVNYKTWLAALPFTREKKCSLVIEDHCIIGAFNHIFCTGSIIIEKGVLTAQRVYISDNLHDYKDIHVYIRDQPILQNRTVVVGEGSWLGENVCILGCKIGKHCTIGSNSVVTKDIPDYCVAVGIPAKIIKRYDFSTQSWRKTNPQGEFID